MAFNAAKLTIYAVMSAIETDLRNLANEYLRDEMAPEDALGRDSYRLASERLNKEHPSASHQPSLADLLLYVDFPDAYDALNRHRAKLPQLVGTSLQQNTPRFTKLIPIRNRVSHSRPLQYDDLAQTLELAEQLASDHALALDSTRDVLRRLRDDPSFVLGLTIPPPAELDRGSNKHNLPTPDFDETGFVGRQDQVNDLIRKCRGAYPVITIVGEGGAGKTALALKVAYELLDAPDNPFEAIVWTSSKTMQLTVQEIVRVEHAISDSLGVLRNIADALGADAATSDPLSEVLDYLAAFRIFLILDNLETVLDRRLREFLERLPHGSKVLITSRIGVGAFENPVRLQSLTPDEAVLLLRALAKSRGVDALVRTSNKNLTVFCARMKNNPGFIKWFVAAVQAGKRPEDVLAHPDLFLDYCMSTVYDFLSDASRCVLSTMSVVPERHSQAELAYLSDLDYMEIQRSLQQLLSTNMIQMESIPRSASFETRYGLSDLARAYLQKHHPADSKTFQDVNLRKRQMVAATEGLRGTGDCDPYSFYSIQTRSRSDLIVAKYLRDAIDAVFAKRAPDAEPLIDKALGLSPEYFEVHRVAALVYVSMGNYARGQSAYEAAIELEPKSAPLRMWYGGFLLRDMNDPDSARWQFEEALKLDPEAQNVEVELARCHLYTYRFDDAEAILVRVRECKDLPDLLVRKVSDLLLQVDARSAEHHLGQRDPTRALSALASLRSKYQSLPESHVDRFICRTLRKAIPTAIACERALQETAKEADAKDLCDWLQDFDDSHPHSSQSLDRAANFSTPAVGGESGESMLTGTVEKIVEGQPYGFIRTGTGRRLFFHRNSVANFRDWFAMSVGSPVKFELGSNAHGTCAENVVLKE